MDSVISREQLEQRIRSIPLLSPVAQQLLTVISDRNHRLSDVIRIVEYDPHLTMAILRFSNAAVNTSGREITSLHRAIVRLGEMMVFGIAIKACTVEIFNRPLCGFNSTAGEIWAHSVFAALAARAVAVRSSGLQPSLAFTAGLLHDAGKALVSPFLEGRVDELLEGQESGRWEDFAEAESAVLGVNHAEAGAQLARHWNLPTALCESIRHHHRPSKAPAEYRGLVYAVHVADILAMMEGFVTGADGMSYRLDEDCSRYVEMDRSGLDRLVLTIHDEFSRIRSSMLDQEEMAELC